MKNLLLQNVAALAVLAAGGAENTERIGGSLALRTRRVRKLSGWFIAMIIDDPVKTK